MRISDWSSDVCSSDLNARLRLGPGDMAEQPWSGRGGVGPGIGEVRNGGEADEAIFDRERDIVGQMQSVELDESPRAGELRLGCVSRFGVADAAFEGDIGVMLAALADLGREVGHVEDHRMDTRPRDEGDRKSTRLNPSP